MADVETVEKRVEGLAERIIAEDAVKRMEELVSDFMMHAFRCFQRWSSSRYPRFG